MGTLIDVNDYFKNENLPFGNPWQKSDGRGLISEKNKSFDKKDSEEPLGYNKQELNNNSKKNDKIK